jgi:hypothetical protein
MNAIRPLVAVTIAFALMLLPTILRAQVTADDFMPAVQGGPTDVKEPTKVKVEKGVVSAPTAQDAINTAVHENTAKLKANQGPHVGAVMVTFPSGLGFVATGAATYRTMDNSVATRISKRMAYVIAFTDAKRHLAEALGGLTNEGIDTIRTSLVNINLNKQQMTNQTTEAQAANKQVVELMLRGFVIYEVKDDTETKTVSVSIVTTPKTCGKLARPAPNAVEANSIREGLNQVIIEVRTGLVPPVGGRIITMRSTGETAFVGFGSAVVRTSSNSAVQAKLNLEAQKIAAMRAKDALCGLMIGDTTSWEGGVRDSLKDQNQEFESATADDPLARQQPEAARKLATARQEFVSRMESTDLYQSVRRGVVPPGINTKTWFDEDNAWAYAMSVYVPSATNAAAGAAREMQESQIVQPVTAGGPQARAAEGEAGKSQKPSSGFTDEDTKVRRPGNDVKPGPSGKIKPE